MLYFELVFEHILSAAVWIGFFAQLKQFRLRFHWATPWEYLTAVYWAYTGIICWLWCLWTAESNKRHRQHRFLECGLFPWLLSFSSHDDVIKWKQFPRYWPFVRGIHRGPVNSPHKGQWRGALMFSLICAQINIWVNNREAGDLRRHHAHYDVTVMDV